MKKTIIITCILLLITIIACAPVSETKPALKVGVVASLTGVGSFLGQQEIRGLELAKEQINSQGGIDGKQIEFVIEDSKSELSTAVTAFNKLADVDDVSLVIGDSFGITTSAMVPVANEKGVLLISPIASLDELSKDDLFFRTIPNTNDMMKPLVNYAFNKLGARTAALLVQENQFGLEHANDFKKAFESLGGKILIEEHFDIKNTDLRTELTKIKEKNPDVILNLHAANMVGLVLKQAKELGINNQFLSHFGAQTATLIKDYGAVSEGLIYPYPYDTNAEIPSMQSFAQAYKAKYNEAPDNTAANSYDALSVLDFAIEKAGENPQAVKQALLAVKNYQGGSGVFSFDENGDVKKEIIIKQLKNGKFVRIS